MSKRSRPSARSKPAVPRRKLTPMRNSGTFKDYILGQLSDVADLHAKAMFGGLGLYSGELFFGIVAADVLYLKVDDGNRAEYENAGMAAFKPFANRPMSMNYFTVPPAVLEDAESLGRWASRAIAAARRKIAR